MRFATSWLRADLTAWLRRLVALGIATTSLGVLNLAGCPSPTYTQMLDGANLDDVKAIRANEDLDEDEKEQALRDLGIQDDQILFLLLKAPLPNADE